MSKYMKKGVITSSAFYGEVERKARTEKISNSRRMSFLMGSFTMHSLGTCVG